MEINGLPLVQSSHRATSFVNSFKRQGKIPAVVEYVAAGSRFKYGVSIIFRSGGF